MVGKRMNEPAKIRSIFKLYFSVFRYLEFILFLGFLAGLRLNRRTKKDIKSKKKSIFTNAGTRLGLKTFWPENNLVGNDPKNCKEKVFANAFHLNERVLSACNDLEEK